MEAVPADDAVPDGTDKLPLVTSQTPSAIDVPAVPVARTAGLGSSVFNLTNSIIGSGVLALPYCLMNAGLLFGLLLLLVMGLCMLFTLHELAVCCDIAGADSYEKLGFVSYGRRGSIVVQLSIVTLNFGTLVSYIVIVKDLALPVFRLAIPADNLFVHCAFFTAVCTVGLMLPLSLLERVRWLAFTSFVAVALYGVFVVVVVLRFGTLGSSAFVGSLALFRATPSTLSAFSIIAFAYSCETNLYPVINELVDPSTHRISRLTTASVGSSYLVYTVVATCGYLTFGAATDGNIFNSYSRNDVLVNVMRALFALTVMFTFPLMAMPCRRAIDSLLFFGRPYSYRRLVVAAVCVVLAALGLAIVVPNVATVFDITGSSAAMLTTYVLPAVFFRKVHANLGRTPHLFERAGSIAMIVIGGSMGLLSLGLAVYNAVTTSFTGTCLS